MNKDYTIYSDNVSAIPEEDKARLDGYLRGRAEAALLEKVNSLNNLNNPKRMAIPKTRKKKKSKRK